jgi:hypothetical protein
MNRRFHPVLTVIAAVSTGLAAAAAPASGQLWELDVRRVTIDHDRSTPGSESGEQIPRGFGFAARHVWRSGVFVEFEASRGSDDRDGAICGGFIFDPATQCVPEIVRYSGGLVAVSSGLLLRLASGSGWSLGVRPRVGLGAVWVEERGLDTGFSFHEAPMTLLWGLAVEVRRELPWYGLGLLTSAGADRLHPVRNGVCLDCWTVIHDPLPHVRIGLGLTWRLP